jgi:hypothetical protein
MVDAFRRLLDPESIHARQPPAPEAVDTPYVVVWLLRGMAAAWCGC